MVTRQSPSGIAFGVADGFPDREKSPARSPVLFQKSRFEFEPRFRVKKGCERHHFARTLNGFDPTSERVSDSSPEEPCSVSKSRFEFEPRFSRSTERFLWIAAARRRRL